MKINWKRFLIILIITFVIGGLFSFLTMNNMDTYNELSKPFTIPGIIFPIVWSILYILMSISCYIVSESDSLLVKGSLILYGLQLIINSLWTLIFFGFEAYLLSFIWLILLLITVIAMIIKFYKINKTSAYLQIPYILWLIFAGYLNFSIYLLNR